MGGGGDGGGKVGGGGRGGGEMMGGSGGGPEMVGGGGGRLEVVGGGVGLKDAGRGGGNETEGNLKLCLNEPASYITICQKQSTYNFCWQPTIVF